MPDLFKEILPSILTGKEPVQFENANREYNAWLINQALSYHMDCVFFAAEMNRVYDLDKQMQYDFMFYGVKKKKRPWNQWVKKEKSEDVDLIVRYFMCSKKKAKDYINILTDEQLRMIRNELDEGGMNDTRKGKGKD